MARIAFIMDKLLRKLGLSGRSFVPLLIDLDVLFLQLWQQEHYHLSVIEK